MKVLTPHCPTCGALARGTLEVLTGCAELTLNEEGVGEYSGNTVVFWDGQMTERDPGSEQVVFLCREGHEWGSDIEDEPETLEALEASG